MATSYANAMEKAIARIDASSVEMYRDIDMQNSIIAGSDDLSQSQVAHIRTVIRDIESRIDGLFIARQMVVADLVGAGGKHDPAEINTLMRKLLKNESID